MNFEGCSEMTTKKLAVMQEARCRLCLSNPGRKTVRKVQVDGCLIVDDRKRCDYLCEVSEPIELALYIELKGTKRNRGVEQLEATLGHLSSRHASLERSRVKCVLVTAPVPKARPSSQELRKQFVKKTGVQLVVVRSGHQMPV